MTNPSPAINFCQEHLDAADFSMHAQGVASRAKAILAQEGFSQERPGRIYFGSYYCEHLFYALTPARIRAFETYCATCDIRASLVIPSAGESTVERIVALADALLENHPFVDEVVVNDLGMLAHFVKKNQTAKRTVGIQLGRMWHKELRDPRYRPLMEDPRSIHMPAAVPYENAISGFEIDPVALELDFSQIPSGTTTSLHLPYCHLSTGRICVAQSRNAGESRKFLPGEPCGLECLESFTWFNVETLPDPLLEPEAPYEATGNVAVMRKGRMIVFDNANCRTINGAPDRVIIAPRLAYDESEAYYG